MIRTWGILICFAAFAACEKKDVTLKNCWENDKLEVGSKINGKLLIFYNPDGPALAVDYCEQSSMILTFGDKNLERSALDTMRQKSTGKIYGGSLFQASIDGQIIRDDESSGPPRGRGMLANSLVIGSEIESKKLPLK